MPSSASTSTTPHHPSPFFFLMSRRPPNPPLFPSPPLFRSETSGTLHVVVTSSEGSVSTPSSADIAVTVNPVAEAAVLTGTVLTASGNEGTAIGLTIVAAPVDGDDNLSINIDRKSVV